MSNKSSGPQVEPNHCALCGQPLSKRELEVCQADPQRFAGQFAHQKRFNACSAVRWSPGRSFLNAQTPYAWWQEGTS